jgi:hypothetical protein
MVFRYRFNEETQLLQEQSLTVKLVTSGNELIGTITSKEEITITQLGDKGLYTYTQEGLGINFNKLPQDFKTDGFHVLKKGDKYISEVNSRGEILKVVQNPLANFHPPLLQFPNQPIGPGDSWQGEGKLEVNGKNQANKLTWTLDKITIFEGRKVAIFIGESDSRSSGNHVSLKFRMMFDLEFNLILRHKLSIDMSSKENGNHLELTVEMDAVAKPKQKQKKVEEPVW